MENLNFFNINFNVHKFWSLAYGWRNVAILDKFDVNWVFSFSFKKDTFADRVFTLMLVYENNRCRWNSFKMLQYLVATYPVDIIAGDFNYDLLKVSENKLLDIFTDGK